MQVERGMNWRPSKFSAAVLQYIIKRSRAGTDSTTYSLAQHFRREPGPMKRCINALIQHGYARYNGVGYAMPTVLPLRYPDGRELEDVASLAGCRVEKRPDLPVPVTICPPRTVAGPTFPQRVSRWMG